MIVTRHVPDVVHEFTLRCLFNTLLLVALVLPLFDISAEWLTTLGIVIILDLANRAFTKAWLS